MTQVAEVTRVGGVDALLVDLDDTLYDYVSAERHARRALVARIAADTAVDAELVERAFVEARDTVKARLGPRGSAHSRLLYLAELLYRIGRREALERIGAWEALFWASFLDVARLRPRARELLAGFRAQGGKVAIVTDLTLSIQLRKLDLFSLYDLVDVLVASEEVPADKPSTGGFELAVARLGLAPDARYVVIGDSDEKDGGGAKAMGFPFLKLASDADVTVVGRALGVWT